MITALSAAKAYGSAQNLAKIGGGAAGVASGPEALGGSAFSDMLKGVIEQTTQSSRAAETQMAAQVQGKAELIDVVTAVSAAEASLETVMAVRDQVIAAYQEIMRMPI
ncbi:MAG: flagellar hook-basal body complex protein FliE [Proteobacteria bacterium]|nr:flagellar hook-basal body complex protein FliE [Pseudomonadota bacterium]